MKIPPAEVDKDKPKTIKGKKHYWCSKYARWGGHTKSGCKGTGLDKDLNAIQMQPKLPQTMAH